MSNLGKLVKVDFSKVWENESAFDDWLTSEEGMKLLSNTIAIDLEVEEQQKSVGPFSADILCKDTLSNNWVVIENQVGKTNHDHLGKLATYAAGIDAVTIIWIAERFTDEHRATLDWLNEHTDENINLFGLEIELWRVDDSRPAPKFNMVSKPNEWSKTVKTTAGTTELSDTKKLQLEYWTKFRELMEESESFVRCQTPRAQHWTTFSVGRSYFGLVARVNTREHEIGAYFFVYGPNKQAYYNLIEEQYKQQIEAQMKMELDWRPLPEAKESHIETYHKANPMDRDSWQEQHSWLKDTLEKFHRVLAPIVRELDVSEYQGPEDLREGDDE